VIRTAYCWNVRARAKSILTWTPRQQQLNRGVNRLASRRLHPQAASVRQLSLTPDSGLRLPAALWLLTSYFLAPITASLAAFATRNLMTVFACI
jgi:hypothetical protein